MLPRTYLQLPLLGCYRLTAWGGPGATDMKGGEGSKGVGATVTLAVRCGDWVPWAAWAGAKKRDAPEFAF